MLGTIQISCKHARGGMGVLKDSESKRFFSPKVFQKIVALFPEYFVLPLIVVLLPLSWVRLGCLGQTLRNEQAIIACDPE